MTNERDMTGTRTRESKKFRAAGEAAATEQRTIQAEIDRRDRERVRAKPKSAGGARPEPAVQPGDRAQPEEVAPAYVFLASPVTAGYITGMVLP